MSSGDGVRRRRAGGGSPGSGDNQETKEVAGGRSASVDRSCTYLILLCTVTLVSCVVLVTTIPDHPLSLLLMSVADKTAHTLALTTPFYAVVLDAGSTGSRLVTPTITMDLYHQQFD